MLAGECADQFYELADIAGSKRRGKGAAPISPVALEAVKRIDALFDIERELNGESAERRLAVRRERSAPLVDELETWMRTERTRLSRHAPVAKAMDYMLRRWGRLHPASSTTGASASRTTPERCLRGIALGRKSWLFAGSDRGGERAAAMYTVIVTAKLNDVDPQAWLADVLARIAGLGTGAPRRVRPDRPTSETSHTGEEPKSLPESSLRHGGNHEHRARLPHTTIPTATPYGLLPAYAAARSQDCGETLRA